MKPILPAGRSLSYYGLVSWLIPAAMSGIVCLFAFFGSAGLEYRNDQQRLVTRLQDSSVTISRRLSAELLIGPRGSPNSVAETLREEFDLDAVEITTRPPACLGDKSEWCWEVADGKISAYRSIPIVAQSSYAVLAKQSPSLASHLRVANLLWSTLPIALMLLVGLTVQRTILRRYFIQPVLALVETSVGDKEPKPFWPKELRDISERLYRSFEKRDEAIFAQIARGVIHDLRTLIQSPVAALELSQETANAPEKRLTRLENLERVVGEQLPKIQNIIDTTFDGSRDIPVKPVQVSIEKTLQSAQSTLQTLSAQTGTRIDIKSDLSHPMVAHDPIQLERALTNLLKNGIEAASESAATKKEVLVRIAQTSDHTVIDIEDSGPGLPTSSGRLFKPLKSTKLHGSGLGLVITRKIVSAHGGEILLGRSEELGGARFRILLPTKSGAM